MSENVSYVMTNKKPSNRLLVGTPTLGQIRFEWYAARAGQIIPCNWQQGQLPIGVPGAAPLDSIGVGGCLVADAQNVIVQEIIDKKYEWLFLHEDDVLLPQKAYLILNDYIRAADVPVVSGLYYTKSEPAEPVVYRGRGNSFYGDWKMGQKVWADGVPTGCLLIHGSILRALYEDSEEYVIQWPGLTRRVRRVFESPRQTWTDPESGYVQSNVGTSDLYWCDRVIDGHYLKKAGWPKFDRKRYPFLVDTVLRCGHIDLTSGRQYGGAWSKEVQRRK